MIEGESGTGKELLAKAIHDSSSRHKTGAFVAVNFRCCCNGSNVQSDTRITHAHSAAPQALSPSYGKEASLDGHCDDVCRGRGRLCLPPPLGGGLKHLRIP